MTLIDRLRTEAQREPHEPIWVDAIRELERQGELLRSAEHIVDQIKTLMTAQSLMSAHSPYYHIMYHIRVLVRGWDDLVEKRNGDE